MFKTVICFICGNRLSKWYGEPKWCICFPCIEAYGENNKEYLRDNKIKDINFRGYMG